MSWADSRLMDNVQMYESHTAMPDGTERVQYAYGEPWVMQALLMDDIKFDTPQEAIKFWEDFQKKEEKKRLVIWGNDNKTV